mmetsp:Transcript_2332/g.6781  ORF Transcript_2332/g.6781 Transcript_2332/m.6781 type:complete len:822 (-) Transcript_2332:113-2578(-)|eukprot:CAMPEP_0118985854 /NCGR_PEP_ID=MMETSP1173-20130426/40899_1 /TAXON_ID=1034831 /ORGANISM="Rhizochromulina marina cf, Strain CCMP1243" /LENGTH=821 /DNA_ID=CAMNT_0006936599 /DNA_START=46 /DNA_END=2511 /DNA_ORIENTATION=-
MDTDALRQAGNAFVRNGDLSSGLACYDEAIQISPDHVLYSNRSHVNGCIGDWEAALEDAKRCLELEPTFVKGFYRKALAEIQCGLLDEADQTLAAGVALDTSENHADFRKLMKTRDAHRKNPALRVKPRLTIKDFVLGSEIGSGNFSRIVHATKKSTGEACALKLIQKVEVDRIKRRHPNVHNEIQMEKRALSKLKHDGIVRLLGTFQDHYTLYFHVEFLSGGEVWNQLQFGGCMVGAHPSLARQWLRELVRALEYMHSKGIVHRDLKPENLLLTAAGHVKVIDFGTAKDLNETDLNGPEFVGTPEYMAPEMVNSSPPATFTADLWATGVILYQLLAGTTPFKSGSPYLSFLKIKRGNLRLPEVLSSEAKSVIRRLIVVEPQARIGAQTPGKYDELLDLPFFSETTDHTLVTFAVPALSDLCVRVLAKGIVDKIIRPRKLTSLTGASYHRIRHVLSRMKRLHEPRILRMFWESMQDARCLRSLTATREYIGLEYDVQGHWVDPFVFALGALVVDHPVEDDAAADALEATVKRVVSSMNRLRPKFCCFILPPNSMLPTRFVPRLRATISRVSESIPLAFVHSHCRPGEAGNASFGADYFGFWYGGMRCLVLNSALLVQAHEMADAYAAQETWFDEEVEQGQLGGHHVCVFTFHRWFERSYDEEDSPSHFTLPRAVRLHWMKKIFGGKVRAVYSSGAASPTGHITRVLREDFFSSTVASAPEKSSSAQTDLLVTSTSQDQPAVGGGTDEGLHRPAQQAEEDEEPEDQEEDQVEPHEVLFVQLPSLLHSGAPPQVGIVEVFEDSLRNSFHGSDHLPAREDLARA